MGDVCVNKFWRSGDKFEIRLWHGDSVWSHIEAHAKPPAKLRLFSVAEGVSEHSVVKISTKNSEEPPVFINSEG